MRILISKTFKRIRFEMIIDWQINIGISAGKPWVNGDESFYIWIDLICFSFRISKLS